VADQVGHESTIVWQGDMAFDVELHGHHFLIDADESVGGKNRGPRPKDLLLSGLAGCTGMDVVALLRNRKMPFDGFSVRVDADSTEEHPRVYSAIRIEYRFTGSALDAEKIRKAVQLSRERYCGVSAMLAKVAPITDRIFLNGQPLAD
jgi:putative redox protein